MEKVIYESEMENSVMLPSSMLIYSIYSIYNFFKSDRKVCFDLK